MWCNLFGNYRIYYNDFCQVKAIMNPCELLGCSCTVSASNEFIFLFNLCNLIWIKVQLNEFIIISFWSFHMTPCWTLHKLMGNILNDLKSFETHYIGKFTPIPCTKLLIMYYYFCPSMCDLFPSLIIEVIYLTHVTYNFVMWNNCSCLFHQIKFE